MSRHSRPVLRPAWWKRPLDLAVLTVVAVPALLLCGLVAALVRWRLGSPVLFVQERAGLGGRRFELVKFRTLEDDPAMADGDRMPAFGRWLRSTSLDELPELLNVLRGDMSLVGPRPLLPEYVSRYDSEQARRLSVPAGITGWAQVNGRNDISWEERFRLDIWYVDRVSPWLDLRILARTIWEVVARRGIAHPGHATMDRFRGNG